MSAAVDRLADAFAGTAQFWLGRLRCLEIDEENQRRDATGEHPGSCASHDHCDANELMASAFRRIHGRDFTSGEDDTPLVNAAWDKVRAAGFAEMVPGMEDEAPLRGPRYLLPLRAKHGPQSSALLDAEGRPILGDMHRDHVDRIVGAANNEGTQLPPVTQSRADWEERSECPCCGGRVFWSVEEGAWLHEASGVDHEVPS